MKYIPNILTIFRIILIPFIAFNILSNHFIVALFLFTISAISDIADGCIARKYNIVSNLGKLLDPLADKLTQISILASLVIAKIIPLCLLIFYFLKDLLLIIGSSILYFKKTVVSSKWYGKFSTCLLYLAIVFSLILEKLKLTILAENLHLLKIMNNLSFALYLFALLSTFFAFIMYVYDVFSNMVIKASKNKQI